MIVACYFFYGDNFFFYYPEYAVVGCVCVSCVHVCVGSWAELLLQSLRPLSQYHRILSFSLYLIGMCCCSPAESAIMCVCVCVGFVMFVLTLKKDHYQIQFGMVSCVSAAAMLTTSCAQFGWSHLTLFLLGSQAYLIIQNLFEGLFWFMLPVSMVICNDIMAYLFGECVRVKV